MSHRSSAATLACVVLMSMPASAQEAAWVYIETNESGAHVYADSIHLGTAAQGIFAVQPGEVLLRLTPPQRNSWSMESVEERVVAAAGDTVSVAMALPFYYRVESVPYGGSVFIEYDDGRQSMGETPLTFSVPEPLNRPVVVDKFGYLPAEIEPGVEHWNRHLVMLERAERVSEEMASAEVPWTPPRSARARWIDYGALGLAVVSAVVAVNYKFRADDLYDEYEQTGDPALRDRITRFDTRSGIALGTMQVGLGIFAIRLALK